MTTIIVIAAIAFLVLGLAACVVGMGGTRRAREGDA
jgi:hypothetical protein